MNVYVDSSVLLAIVLAEPGRLRRWKDITQPIASELIRIECLRTIDRARVRLGLPEKEVADRRAAVLEHLEAFHIVPLGPRILERAAEPFPTLIGSLDALHLASALVVRAQIPDLLLATHDGELATAARAVGLAVLGMASTAP